MSQHLKQEGPTQTMGMPRSSIPVNHTEILYPYESERRKIKYLSWVRVRSGTKFYSSILPLSVYKGVLCLLNTRLRGAQRTDTVCSEVAVVVKLAKS